MPLDPTALQSALETLFSDPPPTAADCASAWASAARDHAVSVVPSSTSVATASTALEGALASAFAAPDAVAPFDAAFASFAAAVGVGMAPAFAAVPPPAPLNVASLLAAPAATHAAAAASFAALIDAWMRTGTATLVAPPNTLVNWT
jgi:hypothetical protein